MKDYKARLAFQKIEAEELVKQMVQKYSDPKYDGLLVSVHDSALPPVIKQVTADFAIHQGNMIFYKGHEIVLEPQDRRIAALIISKEIGQYTTREQLKEDGLTESYISNAETDKAINQRINDSIYQIRQKFKTATHNNKDYFPSKRGVGYKFSP